MSKRTRQREPGTPTLFDLPLNRDPSGEPEDDANAPDAAKPGAAHKDAPKTGGAPAGGGGGAPAGTAPAVQPELAGSAPAIDGAASGSGSPAPKAPAVQPELPVGAPAIGVGTEPAASTGPVAAPPPSATVAPTLADRLLAGIADLALHAILLVLAAVLVRAMEVPLSSASWPSFALLLLPFSFLYWVVPLAFWGQTPGMAWRGHHATALDGEPLSFAQSALRWLGAVVTAVLAGLPLLLALAGGSLADRLSQSRTRVEPTAEPALAG